MKFTPVHTFLPQKQQNKYDQSQLADAQGGIIDGNGYGKERYLALGTSGQGYNPKSTQSPSSTNPPVQSDSSQDIIPTTANELDPTGVTGDQAGLIGTSANSGLIY